MNTEMRIEDRFLWAVEHARHARIARRQAAAFKRGKTGFWQERKQGVERVARAHEQRVIDYANSLIAEAERNNRV